MRARLLALLCVLIASPAWADSKPAGIPAVAAKMAEYVKANEIAGAVTVVVEKDGTLYEDCVGHADLAAKKPMSPDTVFWIASMTKPITGAAIMILWDEKKLSLDDPISKYIPEAANLKGPDGKPAVVTIRHILTHTAGLAETQPAVQFAATKIADLLPPVWEKPLAFAPGSQWRYCQSGINTAGRIVEIVSGQDFPEFVEQRIFKPLGMVDTTFYLGEAQAARLAKTYAAKDGTLTETGIRLLGPKPPTAKDRTSLPNGGLFSTGRDYARFLQMALNGGMLNGTKILSPEAVKEMTRVHSGDVKTGFTPGNGWGVGWCVVREPQGVTAALSAGSAGHGGAYGTQAWADFTKGRAYILMVQRANFANSDGSDVRKAFQDAAAAVLK
jgi:CubicO group peptidase (beta-lactamase class C family)